MLVDRSKVKAISDVNSAAQESKIRVSSNPVYAIPSRPTAECALHLFPLMLAAGGETEALHQRRRAWGVRSLLGTSRSAHATCQNGAAPAKRDSYRAAP